MSIPAIGTRATEVGNQEPSVDGAGHVSLWLHPKPLTWIKPGVPGQHSCSGGAAGSSQVGDASAGNSFPQVNFRIVGRTRL